MINILLVEDDQIIQSTVKYYLKQEGFELTSAVNRQTGDREVKG